MNKKLKIGYMTINVKHQSHDFKKDNMADSYGQWLSRENKIEIQPNLTNVDEANSIIHEILHVSNWVTSLNQKGQPLECEKNEEIVVNNSANTLTQVFIDNKWLLPYLIEKLNHE